MAGDQSMKKVFYRDTFRRAILAIQIVALMILIICFRNLNFWTGGSFNPNEVGQTFEETSVFLTEAEDLIRRKIESSQNQGLFETDGEEDLSGQVNILEYADGSVSRVRKISSQDVFTTYKISDLLSFHADGEEKMLSSLSPYTGSGSAVRDWNALSRDAADYETVLPVSGMSLSEYSTKSASPFSSLLSYYQALCQTSSDIAKRYDDYRAAKESGGGEYNADAPSNIRYFIQNSSTGECFTNLDAHTCSQARRLIREDDTLKFLFEGERSYNIMVANSEYVLNSAAADWFIGTVFLNSSERVVLAYDPTYAAGDILQSSYRAYEQRVPVIIASILSGALALLALVTLFILSILSTGRKDKDTLEELTGFDTVPTEVAFGVCLVIGMLLCFFLPRAGRAFVPARLQPTYQLFEAGVLYFAFALSCFSLARRIKWRALWSNSVSLQVLQVTSRVYSARRSGKRMLVLFLVVIGVNFFAIQLGTVGKIVSAVIDIAVLLYLLRDEVGKQSIREGLTQISKGKLDYRISTDGLTGESLEMAEAVNEMGDGLEKAVDSMIQSERLKAELITNVSHDLKTPLTSIINYVDLLQRLNLEDPKAREYIDVLARKSDRLRTLIQDLIDASRLNSGSVKADMCDLDLRAMLMQAEGEFEERFEERGISCRLDVGREKAVISADGAKLARVLENLLSNIAKYAKEGSEAEITLRLEDGKALATFANESQNELEKSGEELEERFVRGDLSRSSEGSGLGLSIAKSLTELMGGTFSVTTTRQQFTAKLAFPLKV